MDSVSKLETIYEPWSKERPVDGQVVQINLLVCLVDGTEVEDSRKRTPICFVLGSTDVIEGINIAVRGFGQGERSKVKICSELAYGYEGLSPLIPPNADLICDIELVDFRDREKLFDKPLMCSLK
ncbi:hypothetical protein ACHAWO_005697 [Cyclotella atomus]|uniref:peptidylprolyl isomerase n=1 Tax=Cyclotella atomus TaxID=382360 RepID=A0ABD3PA63_9STRA